MIARRGRVRISSQGRVNGERLHRRLHGADEAIAAARDGFDVTRSVGVVTQHATEFLDGGVEGVVEIDERVLGPDALAELFASDQYSRFFEKRRQYLKRLTLAADAHAVFAKNASLKIELEDRKPND